MVKDSVVDAAVSRLVLTAVPKRWRVTTPDGKQNRVTRFCEDALSDMERSLADAARELVFSAVVCGVGFAEIGIAPPLRVLDLKVLDPKNVRYERDKYGVVTNLRFRNADGEWTPLNPYKFLVMVRNRRFNNLYGVSDLRSAYLPYRVKGILQKARALYLEKFAHPPLFAYLPPSMKAQSSEAGRIRTLLENLRKRQVLTIPADVRIGFMEVVRAERNEFESAMNALSNEIRTGILTAFLMAGEGLSSTSRSAAELHEASAMVKILTVREQIEDVLSRQLLYRIAAYRYGKREAESARPTLEFIARPTANPQELANTILALKEAGYKTDVKYLSDRFGMPLEDDEIDTGADVGTYDPKQQIKDRRRYIPWSQRKGSQEVTSGKGKEAPVAEVVPV